MIFYPDSKTKSVTSEHIELLISDKNHVFILIYMDGCGPCNATRPEWEKLENLLQPIYSDRNDVAVINIERQILPTLKSSLGSVDGFPSIKYITNNGKTITEYEDSNIQTKDRSASSFMNWIESNIMPVVSSSSSVDMNNSDTIDLTSMFKKHRKTRKTIKTRKTRNHKYKYTRRRNGKSKKHSKSKRHSKQK